MVLIFLETSVNMIYDIDEVYWSCKYCEELLLSYIVIDVVLGFILVYLFANKLFKLLLIVKQTHDISDAMLDKRKWTDFCDSFDVELSYKQKKLLRTIVKV